MGGDGLALAGLIVGYVSLGLSVLVIVGWVVLAALAGAPVVGGG